MLKRWPNPPRETSPAEEVPLPPYGSGIPDFTPDAWRKYLVTPAAPLAVLEDIVGIMFVELVDPREITLTEATEGVRRAMMTWDPILRTKSDAFASEAQCHDIASSLLAEAGLLESAASRTTSPRSLSIDPKPPSHLREELYPSWSKYLFGQACAVKALMNACGLASCALTTSHGVWHYFDSAPNSTASPLVMIHGMFTTSISLGPLGALLAQRRRVVIPDLLEFEFGWSYAHDGQLPSWNGFVPAVAGFIEKISCGLAVDVIGHSFGGWLAAHVSRNCPHLIKRLVLIAPGGLDRYRCLYSARMLFVREAAYEQYSKRMPAWMSKYVADGEYSFLFSGTALGMLRSVTFREYFAPVPISHPCLLIWGTQDTLHKPWDDQRLCEWAMMKDVGSGEGVWVEGGGHALVIDSVLTLFDLCTDYVCGPPDASPSSSKLSTDRDCGANKSVTLAALCAIIRRVSSSTRRPIRRMNPSPLDDVTKIRCKL